LVFGAHEDIVQDIEDIFTTFDFGDSQSPLISGLRGAGKTSMLGLLRRRASDTGWFVITDDASTGLLRRVTGSTIPRLLAGPDEGERLRFTSFGVGPISAKWEKTATRPPAEPLLRHQLVALAAARDNAGILITIDEVSSGKVRLKELSRLALEIQHAIGDGANIRIGGRAVERSSGRAVERSSGRS
jgi:hypothetical protein